MNSDQPARVRLVVDGAVATITNDNPDKHNAFDDDMDAELFAIFDELARRTDVRAIVWRGEGKSFSSGRDASSIGNQQTELSHHELMRRGHRGIQRLWISTHRSSWPARAGSWAAASNGHCSATSASPRRALGY